MREFASCFGDPAVRVAETRRGSGRDRRLLKNTVTDFYKVTLSSSDKELVVKVSWSRKSSDTLGSVVIEDTDSVPKQDASNCQLLRRKKGSRSFVAGRFVVSLHWDISEVKYGSSPVPVKDFYVILIADAEFALLLGDTCGEFIMRFGNSVPIARSSMFGRRDQVHATGGVVFYTTRARFLDGGREHEMTIECRGGDEWEADRGEVHVCVDGKRVVSVRTARWNFRGNQMVFIDGAVVDVMWDVHDWWFCKPPCAARFVFRARRSLDSSLWSEEEAAAPVPSAFTLLIEAFNSNANAAGENSHEKLKYR